ncbi:glycoside hydrolase family 13 protein [Alkalicoccobacillus murimartini]|uniref:Cyclomaltodextrinase n=1 Tax=Alkalicoccobacillus murimartini TaxID=171685 RepID=A0ABT9YLS2_9BACI|nr:glycoside hydrolase family 13 protein [Alkalicoccobacillus murimartini]MDQ0208822.1 cyclomaltodextrinase [Alkalicoccobacillus murimartini]
MIFSAVSHLQTPAELYSINKESVCVRIKTAKNDVLQVTIIHGDPYVWEQDSWQSSEKSMSLAGSDDLHDYWTVTLQLPHSRLRYGFILTSTDESVVYTERGFYQEKPKHVSPYFCLPYLHENEIFSPPSWVKDTVWYQIFPERFSNGDPSINPDNVLPWGSEEPQVDSFFGGDLQGVINHLDHLSDLGINGIYFTPIFKAFSNHKYDTIDYMQIDPQFGDEQTLIKLVQECHKRGIRVMLDAVFNHSGYYFEPFQDVLKNGEDSRYRDWFHPHAYPLDPHAQKPNYETFAFVGMMPKLNTANPEVKDYLLQVARYWIETFDIDGWRLDVANEVDHDFWRDFRRTVKETKEDVYILGEIWHQSTPWLVGDQFDAVMNYPLTDAIQDFVLREETVESFTQSITRHLFSYPQPVNQVQFNLLDSHDTARVLTESNGNKNHVMLQYLMLFSFPGSPCIYYGDEIGMAGDNDPGCRACMIWDQNKQDTELFTFVKDLIQWRKELPTMGTYETIQFHESGVDDVLLYSTYSNDEVLLIAINRSQTAQSIVLPESFMDYTLIDHISGETLDKQTALEISKEHFRLVKKHLS